MYSRYRNTFSYPYWYYNPYGGYFNSYRRYRDYWSTYDSWYEYFYGGYDDESDPEPDPEPKPEDPKPEDPKPVEPKPDPKPKPPKEELAKVLTVKAVDLKILENAFKHHTDQYDCIEERTREGSSKPEKPVCVIRRGDSMKMKVTFDREYVKEKNDMSMKLTIGDKPTDPKGTQAEFDIDEDGKENFGPEKWGAKLAKIDGKTIELDVYIPSNCVVGKWKISLSTMSHGKDKDGKNVTKKFTYDSKKNPLHVIILFNPWCKEDLVYTNEDKDEYVLNEFGFIYSGNSHYTGAKPWVFGQFKDMILDCALKLLDEGFEGNYKPRWNPVVVCRKLAAMVNMSGWGDKGVLVGNWSGNYEGGSSPMSWIGSTNILQKYFKNGEPVKYGQCWVYSGVLTTVCRALGIPCRSVTNFDSAHDTDASNTIDYFYKSKWTRDDNMTSDSVWNFHVWNEVYMKRLDLATGHDGWQALDATPQELSDNTYTCGPTSIIAVKKGEVNMNYDTSFVFSEVNADKVEWVRGGRWSRHDWVVRDIKTNDVGHKISTKKPGRMKGASEEEFRSNRSNFTREARKWREDLTNQYKYPEGSEEERKAVAQAYKLAMNPRKRVYNETKVKPLEIEFMIDDETMIGDNLRISVKVHNPGNFGREIDEASLHLFPEMYTGDDGVEFLAHDFEPMKVESKTTKFLFRAVQFDEYYQHLIEDNNIHIVAYVHVKPIAGEAEQEMTADYIFQFVRPELHIKAPWTVKKNEFCSFMLRMKNPIPIPLTECRLSVQSGGFDNIIDREVPEISASGTFEYEIDVKSNRKGEHNLVFDLETKELYAISGVTSTMVET